MNPKVVIFSAFLSPFRSGAEACAEEVALELCEQFDITIITARLRSDLPRHDLLQRKVPIIRIGIGHPIDKWLYPFLAPVAARKLKPDLLHAVLETFAGMALHFARVVVPRAKQVLTLQTTNRHFLRRHILRTPHTITAISSVLVAQAKEMGKEAQLIPNGIHYREIRAACEAATKAKGRILFVGRLESMKGVDTLLDAFALVHREATRATLEIVGDGSLRPSLEEQLKRLGLADYVTFRGYVPSPELYRAFAEAEIFCGLSRSEALGNVFLEAQAADCTVLATTVGGIPDIVESDRTGILIPPDDPALAAEKLLLLLREGGMRSQLTTAAREHAAGYDWKGIAERYAWVYRSLL